jgi:epoxyqueuosine reductase
MTFTLAALEEKARALGIDAFGTVSLLQETQDRERLFAFLDAGHHGSMDWMEREKERRAHPRSLWPEARSAVMVGVSYAPPRNPMERLAFHDRGNISAYAQGRDYHELVKSRIRQLAHHMAAISGAAVKIFVDTAPLMEKPWAMRAGLGWQGKHTNLVSRAHGSWLFLGAILTTLDLAEAGAETDHCGSCTRCLDICPTDAFPAPYQLDARACLAYLTIEHKGPIPEPYRKPMGNRIFGCDDCLAVCPWNKFAQTSQHAQLHARAEIALPHLKDLAELDDEQFRELFAGSPIKRTGRDRFVRNVMIALGNASNPAHLPAVRARLDDASPLVRGAAIWALKQLDAAQFEAQRAIRAAFEADPLVQAEWGMGD